LFNRPPLYFMQTNDAHAGSGNKNVAAAVLVFQFSLLYLRGIRPFVVRSVSA
jgi:hypothetical protein